LPPCLREFILKAFFFAFTFQLPTLMLCFPKLRTGLTNPEAVGDVVLVVEEGEESPGTTVPKAIFD